MTDKKFWIVYYLGAAFFFAFAFTIPHYFLADSCIRNGALFCDFFVKFGGNTMRWIFFTGMWCGLLIAGAGQFIYLINPTLDAVLHKIAALIIVSFVCVGLIIVLGQVKECIVDGRASFFPNWIWC